MKNLAITYVSLCALVVSGVAVQAQETNYDESKVPQYTLPDVLVDASGNKITTANQWISSGRPHAMRLVAETVYGVRPAEAAEATMEVVSVVEDVQQDVRRKQITLRLSRKGKSTDMHLLVYLPKQSEKPVPTFLALNFNGNHTITEDPDVPVTKSWVRNDKKKGYVNNKATEGSRGAAASRWPYKAITSRGYGLATIYYGDIDPDFHDEFKNGIFELFSDIKRDSSSWASISAWSWGLSRALDYLEQDDDVDANRVAVMGHSRLGKTSLWAGATDERFAMVVSNNSGCGGAALSRRAFGETVQRINTNFPHWFCDNFKKYNDRVDELPVDQHTLIALIAPRPVLICSAQDDRWADPRGEFLSGAGASAVYELLGTDGMVANEWPGVDVAITSRIGYHIRPGGHDVKLQDWHVYMDFADKHMAAK